MFFEEYVWIIIVGITAPLFIVIAAIIDSSFSTEIPERHEVVLSSSYDDNLDYALFCGLCGLEYAICLTCSWLGCTCESLVHKQAWEALYG